MERVADVQVLDALVPQKGNQLLEVFRHLDSALPEQVIDVPKISHYSIQRRLVDRDLRHPQMAETVGGSAGRLVSLFAPAAECRADR